MSSALHVFKFEGAKILLSAIGLTITLVTRQNKKKNEKKKKKINKKNTISTKTLHDY